MPDLTAHGKKWHRDCPARELHMARPGKLRPCPRSVLAVSTLALSQGQDMNMNMDMNIEH